MATGSYLTPIYSHSQSEIQGDLHKLTKLYKQQYFGEFPTSVQNCFQLSCHDFSCVATCYISTLDVGKLSSVRPTWWLGSGGLQYTAPPNPIEVTPLHMAQCVGLFCL
ncbi:hypothetical protein TNCV_1411201 [Trichonephila clavipes]|nr:hypothetical protein TNCV_1411201 [Trichonephila clavipes]